jgi:hypothetical protein
MVLGYDESDLLTLEDFFVGQYGLDVAGQRRHPVQFERLQVLDSEHRFDTRQLDRRLLIDRFDAGMAVQI